MDERLESGWKWVLRGLGIVGFLYLIIVFKTEAPVAFYVLLTGLLGLPNIIDYQLKINRRRRQEATDERRSDSAKGSRGRRS